MARRKFSEEFKREAVHLITVRGVSAAQAARDLDVHATVLRRWVNAADSKGMQAFPG
ncbi:MAG: transposase, partial [Pseudomonadota bacterium]